MKLINEQKLIRYLSEISNDEWIERLLIYEKEICSILQDYWDLIERFERKFYRAENALTVLSSICVEAILDKDNFK